MLALCVLLSNSRVYAALHVCTSGQEHSGPTVILDAFLGGNHLEWALVQPAVAHFAKVVSYDRAGLGTSEPSSAARTCQHIVEELRTALQNANIQSPYILVGHSSGGVHMRFFAYTYPEEVCGLVLVDSSHEDQLSKIQELKDRFNPPASPASALDLSWLPEPLHALYQELKACTNYTTTCARERQDFAQSLEEMKKYADQKLTIPLTVITRGTKVIDQAPAGWRAYELAVHEVWLTLQKDLVSKSPYGKQIFAPGCGHMIPRERPDIIVDAIKEMVNS